MFEKKGFNAYIEKWNISSLLLPFLKNAFKECTISEKQVLFWLEMAKKQVDVLVENVNSVPSSAQKSFFVMNAEFSMCTLHLVKLLVNFIEEHHSYHNLSEFKGLMTPLGKLYKNESFIESSAFNREIIRSLVIGKV